MTRRKTIAVVASTVLMLVIAVAATCCSIQEQGIDLKQVPPEWKKIEDLKLSNGAFGVAYKGTGTLEGALAVFKSSLEQAGWSRAEDNLQKDYSSAIFRKGTQQAVVSAMGRDPNIIVHILVSEAPLEDIRRAEVPKEDVAGEDIADVLRYPGAVRVKYETAPQESLLAYLAPAEITTVAHFYISQLLAGGWVLQAMTLEKESAEIIGTKIGRGMVTIDIELDNVFNGYTNIEIAFLLIE